jgi:hypothetical protein
MRVRRISMCLVASQTKSTWSLMTCNLWLKPLTRWRSTLTWKRRSGISRAVEMAPRPWRWLPLSNWTCLWKMCSSCWELSISWRNTSTLRSNSGVKWRMEMEVRALICHNRMAWACRSPMFRLCSTPSTSSSCSLRPRNRYWVSKSRYSKRKTPRSWDSQLKSRQSPARMKWPSHL